MSPPQHGTGIPPRVLQRASVEAGPLEVTLSKNTASLGCPKGTIGAPTSHPFPRHPISRLAILPPPQCCTPAVALKQRRQREPCRRGPSLGRPAGRAAAQQTPSRPSGTSRPPGWGSLLCPGGSSLQPVAWVVSPPAAGGEAPQDAGSCWEPGSPYLPHDTWSWARALPGRQLGESPESPGRAKPSGHSQPRRCQGSGRSVVVHPSSCPGPCPGPRSRRSG